MEQVIISDSKRRVNPGALLFSIILMMVLLVFCGRDTFAAENRGTDVSVAAPGNELVTVRGNFYTLPTSRILERINEIRLEACRQGIIDPVTGNPLTLSDYKELKWSSALEWIAQTRAAEATARREHTRTNGTSCFTCSYNGEKSWAENLAWNYDGIMKGIEQWYSEKSDWINETNGRSHGQTGHYKSLISTKYNYVAIGCFRYTTGGWYTVAQEFSYKTGLDESAIGVSGLYDQVIEVPSSVAYLFKQPQGTTGKATVVKKVILNATKATLDVRNNKTIQLSATLQPEGVSSTITWKSGKPGVATVDDNGLVTAVAKGTATITAKSANGKTARCKITVTGPVNVKSVRPGKTSLTLQQGTQKSLTVKYSPAKATEGKAVTWTSDDPSIAAVDENGTITAISEGKTFIRVTPAIGKAGKCKVTVKGPLKVKSVKPSKTSLKLAPGEGKTLTPKYSPAKAVIGRNVTWTSDDPAIARVDENGNVTAQAAGVTYIRVQAEIGKAGKCKVTVK